MPNISEVNRELVKAFNINLRFNSIAVTNLTVQNLHGKDHIVISFDKNMDSKQCMKYLNNMKEKIIKRSYRDEKAAGVSYNLKFFPFAFNTKHLPRDDKGRKKFSVEIDEGVVFNLKCYLAKALVRDIKEKMGSEFGVKYAGDRIYDISFDRSSYLYCMLFHDKGLQKDFVDLFSAEIEGYPNPPSDYLEEKGNLVYIRKSIFDDIEFIKDIIAYNASLECRYLQTPSAKNKTVDKLKYTMIDLIDRAADLPVRTITRTSYVNRKEDSVLIPLVQNGKFLGFLSKDDAYDLNRTFGDAVVTRIESRRLKNPYWSSDYVYAIDFADADISYCVLNKIIESSVINKDHELSIDPELRFRALSPNGHLSEAQLTQVRSPTGRKSQGKIEKPPRQGSERKEETVELSRVLPGEIDQTSTWTQPITNRLLPAFPGYFPSSAAVEPSYTSSLGTSGNERPDSAESGYLGSPGPLQLSKPLSSKGAAQNVQVGPSASFWSSQSTFGNQCTLPMQFTVPGDSSWPQSGSSQISNLLKEDCKKICENFEGAYEKFVSGSSRQPMNFSRSSLSKGAAQNVQVGPSASFWSSQSTFGNQCTLPMQFTVPGDSSWPQSGPSSFKSTPAAQPQGRWSSSPLPPPPFIPRSSNVSGSQPPTPSGPLSFKSMPAAQPQGRCSLPPPLISSSSNVSGFQPLAQVDSRGTIDKPLTEEEKLIKALLYTLNLTNYTNDGVYTNFFAKDGKIISLLHDNVDREKYSKEVRNYIIEGYCGTKEEARKLYGLDEFPFEFLPDPDYEKNQNDYEPKKTVVANISSGALSNLKILFSQKFGKNVGAIDISVVKKAEEREKDKCVDLRLSEGDSLKHACKSCFPDEKAMKEIPITLEGGKYVLDRSRDICEVELLFKEQLRRFRGTLVNEEEKELFEALLYAFNYSNNNFDRHDTNFTVKNEKIASLIDDSVNVKKYLWEVRDKTKEEYCKDKKKAYSLNDFPFKFLSNCEKNQKMTVVADISHGALFNLKELFIYGYKKKVKIGDTDIKIGDINTKIVEEAVKSKKDELVDSKLKGIEREGGCCKRIKLDVAVTASYPDKSALERIPIKKYKIGYRLERDYEPLETQEYAQGRSEAKRKKEKMKPDNKDSGISSGEATDAENVSSKAEGRTRGSSKRRFQLPVGEDIPRKFPKRDSPPSAMLEALNLITPVSVQQRVVPNNS